MSLAGEKGLTLVELLVTIIIMGIIAVAVIPLLSTILDAHKESDARFSLYQEGLLAMERMTGGVRRCSFLHIPNNHSPSRNVLAYSGTVNEDGDNYFNDVLFPRIDEDPEKQMTDDNKSGIENMDDDGDGAIDEGNQDDDDEDGSVDEDPLDGLDNDGDGNIDEDTGDGANISGMDDDADGTVDEGDEKDNDEDGQTDEDGLNPVIYTFDSALTTLKETSTYDGNIVTLSTHVTDFEAKYETPARIRIKLKLMTDNGEEIEFQEYVCPRNTLQKTGKRAK